MSVPDPSVVDWVPIGGVGSLPYATSLPTSPVDGQEAILVDSLTAPTYTWRFRFNSLSSSAYKWEFVGGAPITVGPVGSMATTSTAWIALTNGPTVALPRAGDYILQWGTRGQAQNNVTADISARSWNGSVSGAGSTVVTGGTSNYLTGNTAVTERWLGQAAATALSLQVALTAGGSATYEKAWMSLTPVRVA